MLNQLRHLHLSLLKILVLSTLYSLMVACSPNLTTIGTIDETLIITKEEIHEMGFETFKKEYLGKEVTIEGLEHLAHGGGFDANKGQCNISYYNPAIRENGRFVHKSPIKVNIYANSTPSYALKEFFGKDSYIEGELDYDQEVTLPMTVCEKCEWTSDDKQCFYKSPNTTITGKIIQVGTSDDLIAMVIRPKGLAY
jgi:hypothetical protein